MGQISALLTHKCLSDLLKQIAFHFFPRAAIFHCSPDHEWLPGIIISKTAQLTTGHSIVKQLVICFVWKFTDFWFLEILATWPQSTHVFVNFFGFMGALSIYESDLMCFNISILNKFLCIKVWLTSLWRFSHLYSSTSIKHSTSS